MKFPLLYVEWQDHSADAGWQDNDKLQFIVQVCRSVGWKVFEDDRTLVLANTLDAANVSSSGRVYILKSCITKKKTIT